MEFINKEGVFLAYTDINPGSPPMPLLHGWGCDHEALASQAAFFCGSHRVVSVDLRGHGMSAAPYHEYTSVSFADALAWLCTQLTLTKPVVIGHSMGGNAALELAARYPDIPRCVVLIDSFILPAQSLIDRFQPAIEALHAPNYREAYRQLQLATCLPKTVQSANKETPHRVPASATDAPVWT
jgi:pimeloyl-ACP methyl ester carboxylesterase